MSNQAQHPMLHTIRCCTRCAAPTQCTTDHQARNPLLPVEHPPANPTPFAPTPQGSYIYFWLNNTVTLANGVIIAYCIAALCPTLDVANAAVPTLLAIMLFMSGFLIRVPNIPVYWRWITKVNMLHYSWAGLMVNQFEGQPGAVLGGQNILEYYDLLGRDKWVPGPALLPVHAAASRSVHCCLACGC